MLLAGCSFSILSAQETLEEVFAAADKWQTGLSKKDKEDIRKKYFENDYVFIRTMVALGMGNIKERQFIKEVPEKRVIKLYYKFIPEGKTSIFEPTPELASRERYFVFHLVKKRGKWVILNMNGALSIKDLD